MQAKEANGLVHIRFSGPIGSGNIVAESVGAEKTGNSEGLVNLDAAPMLIKTQLRKYLKLTVKTSARYHYTQIGARLLWQTNVKQKI